MAKKKKWKKKLGKALMAGAALAGGLALAKNRNRAASMANVEGAEAGFGDMRLKDYAAHSIGGGHIPRTRNKNFLASPKWQENDFGLGPYDMKDGGRAGHKSGGSVKGVGKAKRGFGRALKKGK